MVNAARIIKGERDLILEIKTGSNPDTYSGLCISGAYEGQPDRHGKVFTYENVSHSKVMSVIHSSNSYGEYVNDEDAFGPRSAVGE